MRLRLLGPLEVDGGPGPGGRRDRVVLARLALGAGEVVSTDELTDALWGNEVPPSAAKNLQGCVVRLRKLLGATAIETVPGGYRLQVLRDQVDVHRFVRLLERARELGGAGDPERAAHAAGEALALWRPSALLELDANGVDPAEQQRLAELHLDAEELHYELLSAAGTRADLTASGADLVRAAPYREHRWALLALAQYRAARQADALATLQRARAVLVGDLGLDPGPELTELEAAILRHDEALLPVHGTAAAGPEADCPFRGLLAYDVDDRSLFFGRDEAVTSALRRLATGRTLAVVGASGSGKSSLVRAGVAASLRDDGHAVEIITPGPDPVDRLGRLVQRAAAGTTIVVDQFEEVFVRADARDLQVLADLLGGWTEHSPLVLTLRADALGSVNEHPRLAAIVERNVMLLGPLRPEDVRAAIEGPARTAGLRIEPGLVEVLLRDVGDEPGALPLLSHVLRSAWLRREGRTLTLDGYEAAGGLRGAIAATAESVYTGLEQVAAERTRQLFLRLFDRTAAGAPVRRRIERDRVPHADELDDVVTQLVDARLVVVDGDGITVAHEALASAWPRLAAWLADDVDDARRRQHLAAATAAWEEMGRPDAELYQGPRLVAAVERRVAHGDELTAAERAFLDASVAADDRQRATLQRQLAARAAANRRLRRSVAAVAVLLVAALGAGAVAVDQSGRAAAARDRAEVAARRAAEGRLIATAEALTGSRRDVGALLAVEAQRLAAGPAARAALLATFTASPGFLGYASITGADPVSTTVTSVVAVDERTFAVSSVPEGILLVDGEGAPVGDGRLGDPVFDGGALAVDGDGRHLAHLVPGRNGSPAVLTVFDLPTAEAIATVTLPSGPTSVAMSPDGRHVAVAGGVDGALRVVEAVGGAAVGLVDGPDAATAPTALRSGAVAFAADGTLHWSSLTGGVVALAVPSLRETARYAPLTGDGSASTRHLLLHDDRTLVGVGAVEVGTGVRSSIAAWDLASGRLLWSATRPSDCAEAAAPRSATAVHCADGFGRIETFDLRTGVRAEVPVIDFQQGVVVALAEDRTGGQLVAIGADPPLLARWDVVGGGALVTRGAPGLSPTAYGRDGDLLLAVASEPSPAASPFTEPAVLDPVTGSVVDPLDDIRSGVWLDAGRLAVVSDDGTAGAYDVAGRVVEPWPADAGGVGTRSFSGPPLQVAFDAAGNRLVLWYPDRSLGVDAAAGLPVAASQVRDGATGRVLDDDLLREQFGSVPFSAAFTRDGEHLVVTSTAGLAVYGNGGEVVARSATGYATLAIGPGGLVVLGDRSGTVRFLDVTTLEDRRPPLTVANGEIQELELSADGELLLVRSGDAVRLLDAASGVALGDPIPVARPDPDHGAALAPDGRQLAVATESGVALWDLDPDHWAAAACRLAGRNLTPAEWDRHIGDLAPYRATCPQYPLP